MIFYRECIIGHIQHSEEAVVKCPYQDDYACDMDIAEYEIKAVYFLYITEKPLIKIPHCVFLMKRKQKEIVCWCIYYFQQVYFLNKPHLTLQIASGEIYQKHLQRGLQIAENRDPNSFHCKTSDCEAW